MGAEARAKVPGPRFYIVSIFILHLTTTLGPGRKIFRAELYLIPRGSFHEVIAIQTTKKKSQLRESFS